MKRLALRALPFSLLVLAGAACGGSMDGGDDASANGDPEPGETEGDTEGEPDDVVGACGELDAASGWLRGEDIESSAESTPERIAAVGARTWDLSLELMRVIEANEAASVAASPASMVAAMGLAYGRYQDGQCGERIAEVMAFPETGDAIHQTIGASLRELEARALEADETSDPVAISLRQSVWAFGSS